MPDSDDHGNAADDDDLFGGWDDDDDEPVAGADRRAARTESREPISRRTMWIVGAAVVVVGAIIAAVAAGNSSNKSSDTKTSTPNSKTGRTSKATGHLLWPAVVSGRPAAFGKRGDKVDKVKAGTAPGVYVWSDFDGWHLWVVKGAGTEHVRGSLTSDANVAKAEAVGAAATTVTKNGKAALFDFSGASGPVVGLTLNPGFFSKSVIISIDGDAGKLDTKLIFLGPRRSKVASNPFAELKGPRS